MVTSVLATGGVIEGTFLVEFDDGSFDNLIVPPISLSSLGDATGFSNPAKLNGWIIQGAFASTAVDVQGAVYLVGYIVDGLTYTGGIARQEIFSGYPAGGESVIFGEFRNPDFNATWVFQGTIAEDATAGTHVCSLTIVPGAGNALIFVGGGIIVGATATAQVVSVNITDGTNQLVRIINGFSGTTSLATYVLGAQSELSTAALGQSGGEAAVVSSPSGVISGTMTLLLQVSTAAVSVTHTFAVICRLKAVDLPTATLADTVGTPTFTTNTSALF